MPSNDSSEHLEGHGTESASNSSNRLRAHSIDLSLELERQLDNESLPPPSPRDDRPQSLDPQVLSAIIINLRTSLAEAQSERDALSAALQASRRKEEEASSQVGGIGIGVETEVEIEIEGKWEKT